MNSGMVRTDPKPFFGPPSPHCPARSQPHEYSSPSEVTARQCEEPQATPATVVSPAHIRQPHACQDDVRHVPEGRGRVTFWAEAADELHAESFLRRRLPPPERCVLRPEPQRLSAVAQEM